LETDESRKRELEHTMKTAAISSALIAALAAGAVVVPTAASAQRYGDYNSDCRAQQRSNGTAGAVIGGIAGALLGSSVAPHHGNRAGGAAIGGVAGALAGNAIGRSSGKSNCYNQGYYESGRYYSYDNRYRAPAPTYYYNGGYDGRYGYNTYYAPRYDNRYTYQRPEYYDPY
jgi:hypothetical protein